VLGAIQLAIEMQIDQASQTVGLAPVINFYSAHLVGIKAQLHCTRLMNPTYHFAAKFAEVGG
jgi:hypothetical protein